MAIWIKQSGQEIKLNDRDETITKAISLGWEPKSSEPVEKVSKKKVSKKVK